MPTNFLQWNPNSTNQENDSQYSADTQRLNGATVNSAFPSITANKLFYQVSTFIAALAQALTTKGYNIQDTSLSTLVSALAHIMTNADMTPYALLVSPAFTGTPTTPTPPYPDNSTKVADTAWITANFSTIASLGAYATQAWVQSIYASLSYVNSTFPPMTAFSNSLGDNGVQKFPGGLIAQWGSANAPTGNGDVIPYNQAFPTNVFIVYGTDGGSPTGPSSACNSVSCMFIPTGPQYLTSFRCYGKAVPGGNYVSTNVNWLALGG